MKNDKQPDSVASPSVELGASIGSYGATLYPNNCHHTSGLRVDCVYDAKDYEGQGATEKFMRELVNRFNDYDPKRLKAYRNVAKAAKAVMKKFDDMDDDAGSNFGVLNDALDALAKLSTL